MACKEECNRQFQGLMARISRAETDLINQTLSTAALVDSLARTTPAFAGDAVGTALRAAYQAIPNIGMLIDQMISNLLPITPIDIKKINVAVGMFLFGLLGDEIEKIIGALLSAITSLIAQLMNLITQLIAEIEQIIQQLAEAIQTAVCSAIAYWKALFGQIAQFIAAVQAVLNDIIGAFNSVIALLNSQLNISKCVTGEMKVKPPTPNGGKKADDGAKPPPTPVNTPSAPRDTSNC